MLTFLSGLGMGLSLIIAIGAQNVLVLRQGLRREHVLLVVVVCAASDAVLILAGVGGLGRLVEAAPWLVEVARFAGAAFLLGYGVLARPTRLAPLGCRLHAAAPEEGAVLVGGGAGEVPEAVGGGRADGRGPGDPPGAATSRDTAPRDAAAQDAASRDAAAGDLGACRPAVRRVLVAVLALTWLNPHVYLDTVFLLGSIASTHRPEHWWFGAGAVLGSILWFSALGFGARLLSRWLDSPRVWRWIDGVIALIMVVLAVKLLLG